MTDVINQRLEQTGPGLKQGFINISLGGKFSPAPPPASESEMSEYFFFWTEYEYIPFNHSCPNKKRYSNKLKYLFAYIQV